MRKRSLACKDRGLPPERHRLEHTLEYAIWHNMKDRCYRRGAANYRSYGGRGIRVCDRWRNSFAAFISDMGLRPSPKHSIDRINNDGNYEPGNCRWATIEEQAANRRPHSCTRCGTPGHVYWTCPELCAERRVCPVCRENKSLIRFRPDTKRGSCRECRAAAQTARRKRQLKRAA